MASLAFGKSGLDGWAVGADGFINRTIDRGATWIPVTQFAPTGSGRWESGRLVKVVEQQSAFMSPVNFPFYDDVADDLVAAVPERTVGTDRWSDPGITYRRLPAPWFWALLFVYAAGVAADWLVHPPDPRLDRSEISSALASDRPIELDDPDPLGFGQIAVGLSRFLRNENTEPPLTIAVTGEWGTGKSSLMNLLRGDLRRRGFRPVWFNAWHHQQEEHLLASLLATVRAEAIPTLAQPLAWCRFYSQLLWHRGRRYAPMVVVLLFCFALSAGHVWRDPSSLTGLADRVNASADWVKSLGNGAKEAKKAAAPPAPAIAPSAPNLMVLPPPEIEGPPIPAPAVAPFRAIPGPTPAQAPAQPVGGLPAVVPATAPTLPAAPTPADAAQEAGRTVLVERDLRRTVTTPAIAAQEVIKQSPPYVLIFSALGLLVSFWRGATAFGLKPGAVLASMSNSVKIRDLSAQAGFRHEFSKEFADVTGALRPRTLVLLIDDLDRCHPDHLMLVLETVNFLVSSGQCIVILGMAKTRVVRCIAHAFKDLAEGDAAAATPGGEVPLAATSGNWKSMEDFARNYLEKIINIEVPVPSPTREQSRRLLVAEDVAEPAPGPAADVAPRLPARDQEPAHHRVTRVLAGVPGLLARFGPAVAAAAAVAAGLAIGYSLAPENVQAGRPAAKTQASIPGISFAGNVDPDAESPKQDGTLPSRALVRMVRRLPAPVVVSKPPQMPRGEWVWMSAGLCAAVAALAGAALWLGGPAVVVKDSPAFVKALNLWYPVIIERPYTPRAIKRFLNRMRFIATRLGDPRPEPTRWDRLLEWLDARLVRGRPAATATATATTVAPHDASRDAMIVALCAIDRFAPERLANGSLWADSGHTPAPNKAAQSADDLLLAETLEAHRREFQDKAWPPSDEDRRRFLEVQRAN